MAGPFILQDADTQLTRLLPALHHKVCQNRTELFTGIRIFLADIFRVLARNEKACPGRDRKPCHIGNLLRRLAHNLRIHRSICPEQKAGQLLRLFLCQETGALALQFLLHLSRNTAFRHNRLL